jgi:hypothetical protein
MNKKQKSKPKDIPAYLYKVSKFSSNRLHIEIPSEDRPEFKSGGAVVVIPFDKQIQKALENTVGREFKFAGGAPKR